MNYGADDAPINIARIHKLDAGEPIVAVKCAGANAAFILGEEAILLVSKGGARRVSVHSGAILAAVSDGTSILTGGDDGKVVKLAPDGSTHMISIDARRRWIDRVAMGADDTVAWSAGRQVFAQARDGSALSVDIQSAAGGLAFMTTVPGLVIAHHGGVTLWCPGTVDRPVVLEGKGANLNLVIAPDDRFLVTALHEPALHAWRLSDGKSVRIPGYTDPVRSMGWTVDGRWLATAGSERLILWPFQSADGPMGALALMLAPHIARVVAVACHPRQEIVAVGYADGMVLLARLQDAAEIVVKNPGGSPIAGLAWTATGNRLAIGATDGQARLIDME